MLRSVQPSQAADRRKALAEWKGGEFTLWHFVLVHVFIKLRGVSPDSPFVGRSMREDEN